jgi:hypothetical protein
MGCWKGKCWKRTFSGGRTTRARASFSFPPSSFQPSPESHLSPSGSRETCHVRNENSPMFLSPYFCQQTPDRQVPVPILKPSCLGPECFSELFLNPITQSLLGPANLELPPRADGKDDRRPPAINYNDLFTNRKSVQLCPILFNRLPPAMGKTPFPPPKPRPALGGSTSANDRLTLDHTPAPAQATSRPLSSSIPCGGRSPRPGRGLRGRWQSIAKRDGQSTSRSPSRPAASCSSR